MEKLTDYFDRIYVINLPDRRDRLRSIRRELAKFGLALGSPGVEMLPAVRYREACGFPSPSVRGCFLSHLSILKKARDLKLRNVLIMEDDLSISSLLQTHLAEIMKGVRSQPWGFLYFGHIEKFEDIDEPPTLNRHDGPLSTTHFYAVNHTIFDRLIHYLEVVQTRPAGSASGGPMHYDGALSWFRAVNPDVLTLIAKPNLGWQRPSRSDIHSRWFDRIPGLRQAAALARSLRLYAADSHHPSPAQPAAGKTEHPNTIAMPLQTETENKATAAASQ